MGRRTVLLVAALLVAALGTVGVFLYVDRADERAQEDYQIEEVLVAKQLITTGTSVAAAEKAGSFVLKELPNTAVIEGAVRTTAGMAELVAATDILPGEQILTAKFAAPGTTTALAIPAGKLAVSVQLGDPQRVAGFVRPGSDVAIFVTIKSGQGSAAGAAGTSTGEFTRLLLPRVKVLGVGPTTIRQVAGTNQNTEEVPAAILTLAVDQPQAQKLVFASSQGALYFGLLTSDSRVAPAPGIDIRNLFS